MIFNNNKILNQNKKLKEKFKESNVNLETQVHKLLLFLYYT